MAITELAELTEEVGKRLVNLVEIRTKVADAIKGSEEYKDELGKDIAGILRVAANDTKEGIRLKDGVVRMEQKPTKTLSKERLLELGVSADTIAAATVETLSDPFVRFRPISKKDKKKRQQED